MKHILIDKFGDCPDNPQEKGEWLVKILNYATEQYDMGLPVISDQEWDFYYHMLNEIELSLNCHFPNSPTQSIHYGEIDKLQKIKHNHLMLSLNKTKNIDEIRKFIGKEPYICMGKIDGLTLSLTYEDGKLVRAETRGNGEIGEDVLHNAMGIISIPKEISIKTHLVVDGEICCFKNDFKHFNNEYKNPRNFAAGSIRLLNADECAKRNLTFLAWDCVQGLEDRNTLSEKLDTLNRSGFFVVPHWHSNHWDEDVIDHVRQECVDIPIDGLVFKYDNCEYYDAQGRTDHHFKGGLAYKFYDEEYRTTLRDIEWQLGRTGVLTPVAIFDPVDIDGTTVSRASLHNVGIMSSLHFGDWREGMEISVYKSNEIIPQVSSVNSCPKEGRLLKIPRECPYCGHETRTAVVNNTVSIYCMNPDCQDKMIAKIDHFCSKKGLDIKGLSSVTLKKLYDAKMINKIADIFKLNTHRSEWIEMPGFGQKSVDKILAAIEDAKRCDLASFIAALGIPLIGKTVTRDLAKEFLTYEGLRHAIVENYDFSKLEGFAEAKSNALKTFDYTEADYIFENYIEIEPIEQITINTNNTLKDIKVCITGKLKTFKNRDAFKTAIENAGGKVVGSVTANTNYLINNDVTSKTSKNLKAIELGIEIISEGDFIKRFGL